METGNLAFEGPPEQQVQLLQELVHCLDRERQVLIDLDIPALWGVVDEKHGILQAIEALPTEGSREAASAEKGSENLAPDVPTKASSARKIDRLKEEIRERALENAAFIQDSLLFVDKLIGLFAGDPAEVETYRPHGEESRARRAPIYRREV